MNLYYDHQIAIFIKFTRYKYLPLVVVIQSCRIGWTLLYGSRHKNLRKQTFDSLSPEQNVNYLHIHNIVFVCLCYLFCSITFCKNISLHTIFKYGGNKHIVLYCF